MRAKKHRLLNICGDIDYVQVRVQAFHLTIHLYIKMQRPILVPKSDNSSKTVWGLQMFFFCFLRTFEFRNPEFRILKLIFSCNCCHLQCACNARVFVTYF